MPRVTWASFVQPQFPSSTGQPSSAKVPTDWLCSLWFQVSALPQPVLCDLVPVVYTLWAANYRSLSALPAHNQASLATETLPLPLPLPRVAGAWVEVDTGNGTPLTPPQPQPQAGGGIRAWFWAQPRGPLPRAHLPALRPLPALSLSGSRGRAAPPPAAASGAPRRPEERHGAPAGWGWGRGLGGRTREWTRATAVRCSAAAEWARGDQGTRRR